MDDDVIERRMYDDFTATFPKRVFAWLIDQVLIVGAVLAFYFFTGVDSLTTVEGLQSSLLGATQSVTVLTLVYFTFLEGHFGRSVGKEILGISVFDEGGEKPGYVKALVRRIGLVTPLLNMVDALAILPTDRNQRIFDIVASTIVINADKEGRARDYLKEGIVPEEIAERRGGAMGRSEPSDTKRQNIEGLREMISELDDRLESGEIDKEEYLRLKRKYDARIEELRSQIRNSE